MKLIVISLFLVLPLLISCGSNNADEKISAEMIKDKNSTEDNRARRPGIVGEWEQQYTCFDKNSNYKLDPEEKKPSELILGFDWFKFDADGSCLREKDLKIKGNYEVQETNENKKLIIHNGDNLRYTISELTSEELILWKDGAFMIFKRKK